MICLNMIVKNESRVIRRCLESVKPLIDHWVIVDTGSTDETKEIIEECLQGIPGELFDRSWVDFAHNRNEAMDLVKQGDYLLFIDADETLEWEEPLDKSSLELQCYLVKNRDLSVDFYRTLLIKRDTRWRWEGVLHETLVHPQEVSIGIIPQMVRNGLPRDGARAKDQQRYARDAEILKKALEKDPGNTRTAFYLAQSLGSAGMREEALAAYRQRFEMEGSFDERYLSLYYSGCLAEDLRKSPSEVIGSYELAYRFDPKRAEPLASLTRYLLKSGFSLPAYLLAKFGLRHLRPESLMYVRREVYDYQLLFLFACAAQSLGKRHEAKEGYEELLSKNELPESIREQIHRNLCL